MTDHERIGKTETVVVNHREFSGHVYHLRLNGWVWSYPATMDGTSRTSPGREMIRGRGGGDERASRPIEPGDLRGERRGGFRLYGPPRTRQRRIGDLRGLRA